MIFGLRAVCGVEKAGEAKQGGSGEAMKGAMFVHNALLCLLSLAMFVGAAAETFWRSLPKYPHDDTNSTSLRSQIHLDRPPKRDGS